MKEGNMLGLTRRMENPPAQEKKRGNCNEEGRKPHEEGKKLLFT